MGKTRRDRIRNVRIKEEVKVKKKISSKEMTGERQLQWVGHVFCMTEEGKVNRVMEMRVVERRIRKVRPMIKRDG